MSSNESSKKCWQDFRLCIDRAIDFAQSREGRKKIRSVLVPCFMFGAVMMLITGATWAKLLKPECGMTLSSARFSISTDAATGERILTGNSCPGYNWKTSSSLTAGEYNFSYAVSTSPKISKNAIYVGNPKPINGPIGVALNGAPIYGPDTSNKQDAVIQESKVVDQCGGTNAPPLEFAFSLPITGYYHYRKLPGEKTSGSKTYCPEVMAWYNETKKRHSPLAGFMADGIPIYGFYGANGQIPIDLDNCGGHKSDLAFYHYHFQMKYPYSVNCLKGCADGSMNPGINSGKCNVDGTQTNDYSSLQQIKIVYGGDGTNNINWSGPACLLIFGFLIFIPSTLCCICIGCGKKMTELHEYNDDIKLADQEEGDDDDNIL